jgi:hypothetical protein
MSLTTLSVIAAVLATSALLIWPRLARARLWRAAVTPLASIIGSGFLVLGPILDDSYGAFAPLVMAALCAVAGAFGGAIRFNIGRLARVNGRSPTEEAMDRAASALLAFAYFISVAYYLNLFGAFAVSQFGAKSALMAHWLTSAVFLFILAIGWTKGFHALEKLEQISVGVKLAVIGGLLAGMAVFFAAKASENSLLLNPPTLQGWPALTLAFGLIVTVQGFETSRYMGQDYAPALRIRAMTLAQFTATAIYMVYILLLSFVFAPGVVPLSETAIIELMALVAPILPALLVIAALGAQFSAAIADTGGAGGLMAEVSQGRIPVRGGYLLLVAVGLTLTWSLDVFQIIAYASRAFAAYYALQCAIAALGKRAEAAPAWQVAWHAGLALLAAAMAVFGTPVEG